MSRNSLDRMMAGALACAGLLALASPADALALYGGGGNQATTPGGYFTVNQTTGANALVGDPVTPGGLSGLAFASPTTLYGSSATSNATSNVVLINPTTGALISTVGNAGISIGDLAWDATTSTLYAIRSNADSTNQGGRLYTIDTGTGAATLVGNTGTGTGGGIAFAADGTLYHIGHSVGTTFNALHTLDKNTGAVLTEVSLSIQMYFDGLAIDPTDSTLYAVTGSGDDLYTVATDGTLTLVGTGGVAGSLSDIDFQSVPEPASLALLGLGLAGLGWLRRRPR